MVSERRYDVVVVGAGPAGATLSYELASRGVDVALLEKATLPRYKPCAGGLPHRTMGLLPFDSSDVVDLAVSRFLFTFNRRPESLRTHHKPLVYTVMREAYDHFLVQQAVAAGAKLGDGQAITSVASNGDYATVSTNVGELRARIVVGADGVNSRVAQSLGLMRDADHYVAIQSEVEVKSAVLERWQNLIATDFGYQPWGYGWVFPKRTHLSIGVGVAKSEGVRLTSHLDSYIHGLRLGEHTVKAKMGHRVPLRRPGSAIQKDRALLVGDAAGLTDVFTGEGIYYAIKSAQLAVPTITRNLETPRADLKPYEQSIDQQIMPELRASRIFSRIFFYGVEHCPKLVFQLVRRPDYLWRAFYRVQLGQTTYVRMRRKLHRLEPFLSRLDHY